MILFPIKELAGLLYFAINPCKACDGLRNEESHSLSIIHKKICYHNLYQNKDKFFINFLVLPKERYKSSF